MEDDSSVIPKSVLRSFRNGYVRQCESFFVFNLLIILITSTMDSAYSISIVCTHLNQLLLV